MPIRNTMRRLCKCSKEKVCWTPLTIFSHSMTPKDEKDEWTFDTVKASTVAAKPNVRRQLSVISHNQNDRAPPEEAMKHLDLKDGPLQSSSPATIRKSTVRRHPSLQQGMESPSRKSSARRERTTDTRESKDPKEVTARKVSQQKKQPWQPDLGFGNSGSTIRLFRRESDNSPSMTPEGTVIVRDDSRPPVIEASTKEAQIGRRLCNRAFDPAFQEVHARTSNQAKRDALAKLADAWAHLDAVDPEGEYELLKTVIEKAQADPKLATLLGVSLSASKRPASSAGTPMTGTPQSSRPVTRDSSNSESGGVSPTKQLNGAKLVMAQNNPHLKSHRRRQSGQVALEKEIKEQVVPVANMPGQVIPGLEHTAQLSEMLYGRWVGALRNRWPAV